VTETWSWFNSVAAHHRVTLYAVSYARLPFNYRAAVIKWARKAIKKKVGHLQSKLYLTYYESSKPLGARMGSGRGRPANRAGLTCRGQPLLVYSLLPYRRALMIKKFYKKSPFKLRLVSSL